MSNEMKDYLEDFRLYREELEMDFKNQNPDVLEDREMFIDYLISRMHGEGLPSKEPRFEEKNYSKKNG